jgi:hypothetical protein
LVSGLDLRPVGLRLSQELDELLVIGFCRGAVAEQLVPSTSPDTAAAVESAAKEMLTLTPK